MLAWAVGCIYISIDEAGNLHHTMSCYLASMPRDRRQKRDLHALDAEGMVLCNPRDKEAAHRAQVEGIATEDRSAVTCRKCLSLLPKLATGRTGTTDTGATMEN